MASIAGDCLGVSRAVERSRNRWTTRHQLECTGCRTSGTAAVGAVVGPPSGRGVIADYGRRQTKGPGGGDMDVEQDNRRRLRRMSSAP
jgi:hypothetical protein